MCLLKKTLLLFSAHVSFDMDSLDFYPGTQPAQVNDPCLVAALHPSPEHEGCAKASANLDVILTSLEWTLNAGICGA